MITCFKCRHKVADGTDNGMCLRCASHGWEPSPEQIAAAAAEIRAGWSAQRWENETGRIDEMTARVVRDPGMNQ